jgi:hypothetical protein
MHVNEHVIFQLFMPDKVFIPERYVPESDDDDFVTEEERAMREEKAERIRKMLAAHRFAPS